MSLRPAIASIADSLLSGGSSTRSRCWQPSGKRLLRSRRHSVPAREQLIEQFNGRPDAPVLCRIKVGKSVAAVKQIVSGMKAERTICFELLFGKQLVQRRFVRKGVVAPLVVDHDIVFVAGKRSFDINEDALAVVGIADFSDRAMRTVVLWRVPGSVE